MLTIHDALVLSYHDHGSATNRPMPRWVGRDMSGPPPDIRFGPDGWLKVRRANRQGPVDIEWQVVMYPREAVLEIHATEVVPRQPQ